MRRGGAARILAFLPLGLLFACASVRTGDVPIAPAETGSFTVRIVSRPGVTETLYIEKPKDPVAILILFPGGSGRVADVQGNFLLRSRYLFLKQGFLVAAFDTPSDHGGGMFGRFRLSTEHATDIRAAIRYLRAAAPVPVWLVGTSAGTPSAAAGGALAEGGPDGIVLTSSVFQQGPGRATVWDTDWTRIAVPVLVTHHRSDLCRATPYEEAVRFSEALQQSSRSPKVELVTFEGGSGIRGPPCEAFHYHGYVGIEPEVVEKISRWVRANSPASR